MSDHAPVLEKFELLNTRDARTIHAAGLQPVSSQERIQLLDVLRGIAIFGIFIVNLGAFTGYRFLSPNQRAAFPTAAADQVVDFLIHIFAGGKFYSLFSLLFGIGFAVQMRRAEERGQPFAPLFRRRLAALAIIGLIHILLLWLGDILLLYALVGFLLIPFRHRPDRTLLIWAAALLASPILFYSLMVVTGLPINIGALFGAAGGWLLNYFGWGNVASPFEFYATGGWAEFFKGNLVGVFFRYADLFFTSRPPKVLAMFLIGFCVGRRRIFSDVSAQLPLLRRLWIAFLIPGLAGNIALAVLMEKNVFFPPSWLGVVETIVYAIGVPSLSLFYAISLLFLWQREGWQSRLKILAPVGRLALTNYLLQSVIGVTLFYNIGFGLMNNRAGPALWIFLAVLVFCVQIALSTLWLQHFRYGPVEWLWRWLTYGKRPSILPAQRQSA